MPAPVLARQFHQDGFLGMEAVFGLLEDAVGMEFPNLLADFLAAIGGQAMEHDVAGRRIGQHWGVVAGIASAKLVVYPAVAWLLLRSTGLPPTWIAAGVLIAALPTAANVFVFAQRYGAVPERISAEILLSTVIGAVTFPAVAWLVL